MIQQIPNFFKKCISRENKLLRTQKKLNNSLFSFMPAGMQAFCLWCLCFFCTFPITSQCFMASWTWYVWRLSLPFCRTLFLNLKQTGLQGMIPDAQKKFVRSLGTLLYFKCLSVFWENSPCRNLTSWRGLYFTEHSNWGGFVSIKSWSGNATEDQIFEVKERGIIH